MAAPLARSTERASVALSVVGGALVGLGWGVVARIWMRFISTDPEFSWTGTLFICLTPTIIGSFAGLVRAGRRRGWGAGLTVARVPACTVTVLLGVAAGALMLPTLVTGGLAVARTDWPRWLRAVFAVAAAGIAVVVGSLAIGDLGVIRGLVALVWYLGLCVAMVAVYAVPYAPSRARRLPAAVRWVLIVLVAVPVLRLAAWVVWSFVAGD